MNFATPIAFLALPLPFLAWRFLMPKSENAPSLYVPPNIAEQIKTTSTQARFRLRILLASIAWVLLVGAIAGPRVERVLDVVPASGRDIVLAIDLSGSMKTEDFDLNGRRVSRLEAVQSVASEFILSREGDRIGLVLFGDKAYVASPLSFDTQSVAHAVQSAQIGVSGTSTAISDGLGIAIKRLQNSDAKNKVLILLSDGVDTSGTVNPKDAARLAHDEGITIHSIALGPLDTQSNPSARDAVDAKALAEIASEGGGEMFRVRTTADLVDVARAINAIEPSPLSAPPQNYWQDYWQILAITAFITLGILLGLEWRMRI